MPNIQIYSTQQCPYCVRAKALLATKGYSYDELDVGEDEALLHKMIKRTGNRTVPQIIIDGEAIGGFNELNQLNRTGAL